MPQADQDGEDNPQWIQRGLQIVAKVFRIAEVEASAMMMISKPK